MTPKWCGRSLQQRGITALRSYVHTWTKQWQMPPALHIFSGGQDPASEVYITQKQRVAKDLGVKCVHHRCATPQDLRHALHQANGDDTVHGMIVQLPLPSEFSGEHWLEHIHPKKDVDALHSYHQGHDQRWIPCTPWACMVVLRTYYHQPLAGKHAVIVGMSRLVGRSLAKQLLFHGVTVTVAHSRTKNLLSLVSQADILGLATPCPYLVPGFQVNSKAVVLDIGIHRCATTGRLQGNLNPQGLHCQGYTPVPGGIGPVTVLGLMVNTVMAAYHAKAMNFSYDTFYQALDAATS